MDFDMEMPDFSDQDTQIAAGLGLFCELAVLYFMFSDPVGVGFDQMSLFIKLTLAIITGPVMFLVANTLMHR